MLLRGRTRLVLAVMIFAFCVPLQAAKSAPDPWEKINRKTHAFNEFFDNYLLKPLARGYVKVIPKEIRKSTSSFFSNLDEPADIINSLLQGDIDQANRLTGRFLINTTIGVVGLWDRASSQGYTDSENDFGLTLAKWGVNSGPYLVLPLFGPSTVRDGFGRIPDRAMSAQYGIDHDLTRFSFVSLETVDARARLLSLEDMVIGEKYHFYREAWLSQRYLQINGEEQEDDFIIEEGGTDEEDDW